MRAYGIDDGGRSRLANEQPLYREEKNGNEFFFSSSENQLVQRPDRKRKQPIIWCVFERVYVKKTEGKKEDLHARAFRELKMVTKIFEWRLLILYCY